MEPKLLLFKESPESLGRTSMPMKPPIRAMPEARAKAGMFPLPNMASHGPAPSAMIT